MRQVLRARLQSQLRSAAANEIVVRRSIVVAKKTSQGAGPRGRGFDRDIQRPTPELRDARLRAVRLAGPGRPGACAAGGGLLRSGVAGGRLLRSGATPARSSPATVVIAR